MPLDSLLCYYNLSPTEAQHISAAGRGSGSGEMSEQTDTKRMTAGDKLTAKLLSVAPWLAFLLVSLPLPVYFLLRSFAETNGAEYVIFALTSLAAGSLAGLFFVIMLLLYRRNWERKLRDRLASDGVTAAELPHFMNELTAEQRLALKEMEQQSPLLADAYRETLAARVTVSRVLSRTRRDREAVERRIRNAGGLPPANRAELERDLSRDRARLERVAREASEHHAAVEARLQTIEAMAGRDTSEAEIERALLRLGSVREHEPLGLTNARREREAREQVEQELRELLPPQAGQTSTTGSGGESSS
jgi:hypothetical protein